MDNLLVSKFFSFGTITKLKEVIHVSLEMVIYQMTWSRNSKTLSDPNSGLRGLTTKTDELSHSHVSTSHSENIAIDQNIPKRDEN